MTRPSRSRQDLRLDVLKKIDPVSEPKESACTSDCDDSNTLIDTLLAPAAQSEDYVGDWIYVRDQPTKVDSATNVNEGAAFAVGDTTLTVQDGTKFTADDAIQLEDEICGITSISTHDLTVVRGIQGTTEAEHADGTDVFIIGPAIGEIVRVTNVDFSSTNSTLTFAPALSGSLVSTQEYERHRKVRPNLINDKLDETLGLLRQNVIVPVTVIVDGDMEDDPATNFAVGGTETVAADTTYVRHGRQSLKVTAGAALDFAQSTTATNLPGGTQVLVETECYLPTTTGTEAVTLILYDETNSANIETAESDESGWVQLQFLATVPATCEEVSVRAAVNINADVIYFDHLTLWPTYDQGLELPTFLEYMYDAKEIVYFPVGTGLAGSTNDHAYRINEGTPQFYAHYQKEADDTGVVPARLYIEGSRPSHALWVKGRKAYPAFSGATDALKDVDTTVAHRNVVVNMTAASILDDLALDATEAEKPQLSEQLQIKAMLLRNEVAPLIRSMTPTKAKKVTTPFTR